MNSNAPRGTVDRTYRTVDNRPIAVIRWTRGTGPMQAPGDFTPGQSVTTDDTGKVVPV